MGVLEVVNINEMDKYDIEEASEAAILVKRDNGYRQRIWTWKKI